MLVWHCIPWPGLRGKESKTYRRGAQCNPGTPHQSRLVQCGRQRRHLQGVQLQGLQPGNADRENMAELVTVKHDQWMGSAARCCCCCCCCVPWLILIVIAVNAFGSKHWSRVCEPVFPLRRPRSFVFSLVAVAFWIPTSTCGSGRKKQCCAKYTCTTSNHTSNKIS